MDTKLTLKIDSNTIELAKKYAKETRTSISQIVENYLKSITKEIDEKRKVNPIVKSLTGVIELEDDENYKKEYSKFLTEKYK